MKILYLPLSFRVKTQRLKIFSNWHLSSFMSDLLFLFFSSDSTALEKKSMNNLRWNSSHGSHKPHGRHDIDYISSQTVLAAITSSFENLR